MSIDLLLRNEKGSALDIAEHDANLTAIETLVNTNETNIATNVADIATAQADATTALANAATADGKAVAAQADATSAKTITDSLTITDNTSIITNAQIAMLSSHNLAYTKHPAISGTGSQSFNLSNGWLVDATISGALTLNFSNGTLGANGVVKLINTNGNTLTLAGTGLTFKQSVGSVLQAYGPITLDAGATSEQVLTYHFQSPTEVIFAIN